MTDLPPDVRDHAARPECTCTPLPNAEGPCAWCDIHGQPSVAWDQGVEEGRHNERIMAGMEYAHLVARVDELTEALDTAIEALGWAGNYIAVPWPKAYQVEPLRAALAAAVEEREQ